MTAVKELLWHENLAMSLRVVQNDG